MFLRGIWLELWLFHVPPMTQPENSRPVIAVPLFIWWMIWATIMLGFLFVYFVIAAPLKQSLTSSPYLLLVPLGPLAASLFVRFFILPRLRGLRHAFPVFIVGLALAEAAGLLGIFVTASHKALFAGMALAALMIYAPRFAKRYEA